MLLRVALILTGVSIAAAFGVSMVMYGPHSLGIWLPLVATYFALYVWLRKLILAMRMRRSSA
jgi:hypothetical protein